MLRATLKKRFWAGEMPPLGLATTNTQQIKAMTQFAREAVKRKRYYGTYATLQGADREIWWGQWGGPRAMRVAIKRSFTRPMYNHKHGESGGRWKGKYDIHVHKKLGHGSRPGGMYVEMWNLYPMMEDSFYDNICCSGKMKYMEKDDAIALCEMMGWRFALLDENTGRPNTDDFSYIRHKLYQNNFPYIKDPVINPSKGDPDYLWRNQQKAYDYSGHGATSKGNTFTSMWATKKIETKA